MTEDGDRGAGDARGGGRGDERPRVAVFRPDDDRMDDAVALLESLGVAPVPDPMLEVEPTGDTPGAGDDADDGDHAVADAGGDDADHEYVILTSKTGVELAAAAGWTPGDAALCAIGEATAAACRDAGWTVDRVPEEFTSAGLVAELADDVAGASVKVARSDHGSDVLTEGLRDAGAAVHETVLYELRRPPESGDSTELAAGGGLDAALFTSSLTVEHWLVAARERGVETDAMRGLEGAVVGCIGPPTADAAADHGVGVDVVADEADFETLARAVVDEL